MATRITVTVKGPSGIDDPELLLEELQGATGLQWRPRAVDEGTHLSGAVTEILLFAVMGKVTEMSVQAAVEAAKGAVRRWRSEQLDAPETAVGEESVPDADAADTASDEQGA